MMVLYNRGIIAVVSVRLVMSAREATTVYLSIHALLKLMTV